MKSKWITIRMEEEEKNEYVEESRSKGYVNLSEFITHILRKFSKKALPRNERS